MKNPPSSLSITYREYLFIPDFPILLMEGNIITSQSEFIHFHNCIEIAVCEQGTMNWNLENDTRQMDSGSFCLLPSFFTHTSFFPPQEGDVLCYYLFFDPRQLLTPLYPNGLPDELQWFSYTHFDNIMTSQDYPEEMELLRLIIKELQEEKEYYRQTVLGLVEALLTLLYRHHRNAPVLTPSSNAIPQLFPAVSYLNKEYTQEPDISLLAQMCGLSQKRFLEIFQHSFHQTPRQYLRTLRVRKACHLLSSTENSILDIALQTGFQSLSCFNRSFQNIMNCSARSFRNEKRAILKKNLKHAPLKQLQCLKSSTESIDSIPKI